VSNVSDSVDDLLRARFVAHEDDLTPAEARVASFFLDERARLGLFSAAEVAELLHVSDATVIRTAQSLGFAGFADLKRTVRSSGAPVDDIRLRLAATLTDSSGAGTELESALGDHMRALELLTDIQFGKTFGEAVAVLDDAERVVIAGIGPSAAIAAYGELLFSRVGRRTMLFTAAGPSAADDLIRLAPGDAVVMLAYGRIHRHVEVLFDRCQELAVSVVLCTDVVVPNSESLRRVILRSGRGNPSHAASHASTTLVLEALSVALAARRSELAGTTLDQLNQFRRSINGRAIDVR